MKDRKIKYGQRINLDFNIYKPAFNAIIVLVHIQLSKKKFKKIIQSISIKQLTNNNSAILFHNRRLLAALSSLLIIAQVFVGLPL